MWIIIKRVVRSLTGNHAVIFGVLFAEMKVLVTEIEVAVRTRNSALTGANTAIW